MAYTIKKLAELSHVSPRALRFYDEIGLLKPAFYGENNYRYYEEEQLLLLQQILFFRELGFPLETIQRMISSDDFDKIHALQSHRIILEKSLEKTQVLIQTIDKTISHLEGKTTMRDVELYQGFDAKKQQEYEKYLIDNGTLTQNEIDQSWEKAKDWKKENWDQFKQEGEVINKALVAAMQAGLLPSSPEVQQLIRLHHAWVNHFWTPDRQRYLGLADMYAQHPDFRHFYEAYHPKLVEYLTAGMKIFAERELS